MKLTVSVRLLALLFRPRFACPDRSVGAQTHKTAQKPFKSPLYLTKYSRKRHAFAPYFVSEGRLELPRSCDH